MSRAPNFYYQDPTADIGNSLVRAILGDPAMAAQQRQQQAEQAERAAHTRISRHCRCVAGSRIRIRQSGLGSLPLILLDGKPDHYSQGCCRYRGEQPSA